MYQEPREPARINQTGLLCIPAPIIRGFSNRTLELLALEHMGRSSGLYILSFGPSGIEEGFKIACALLLRIGRKLCFCKS